MDVFKTTVPKDHPDFITQVNALMDKARKKGYIDGRNAQTTPAKFKEMLMSGGIIKVPVISTPSPTQSVATAQKQLAKGLQQLLKQIEEWSDHPPQERYMRLAKLHDSGHMPTQMQFLYNKMGHVCMLAMQNTPESLEVAHYVVDNYVAITENDATVMKELNRLTARMQPPNES